MLPFHLTRLNQGFQVMNGFCETAVKPWLTQWKHQSTHSARKVRCKMIMIYTVTQQQADSCRYVLSLWCSWVWTSYITLPKSYTLTWYCSKKCMCRCTHTRIHTRIHTHTHTHTHAYTHTHACTHTHARTHAEKETEGGRPVSYTHLTLPTNHRV